jgi:DNA-binding XRE family transcriptional regulator
MDISSQLKLLRAAKGWTQAEMAEAMGVSPKTFWAMENGCKLTPYMLGKIENIQKQGVQNFLWSKDPRRGAQEECRRAS